MSRQSLFCTSESIFIGCSASLKERIEEASKGIRDITSVLHYEVSKIGRIVDGLGSVHYMARVLCVGHDVTHKEADSLRWRIQTKDGTPLKNSHGEVEEWIGTEFTLTSELYRRAGDGLKVQLLTI